MVETRSFTDEEVRNLLENIKVDDNSKQKYSELFKLEGNIREILKKTEMSKKSFDILLNILSVLRILIVAHTLPDKLKLNVKMETGGFNSNTDFNYYRWLDGIEEITEQSIKKDVLDIVKKLRKLLNDAEKEFIRIQKETRNYGCKLICPYCKNEYIKEWGIKENDVKDEFIEKCPNCLNEYKVLAGKVVLWRSRGTGVVSFGSPEYTVRIKNKNGEKVMVFNSNYNLLHIKTGDGVYFIFKKKILSSQFSEKPFAILDATNNCCLI